MLSKGDKPELEVADDRVGDEQEGREKSEPGIGQNGNDRRRFIRRRLSGLQVPEDYPAFILSRRKNRERVMADFFLFS